MQLVNIGFNNLVNADRVIAVVSPESAPVKRIVQHHMDAAHSGIAQSGFFLFLYLSQPAIAL